MIPRRLAALAAIALLFAACSAGPGKGGELQGTQWVLQSYDDGANLAGRAATRCSRTPNSRTSG